jgi:hypothetical protein
MEIKLFNTGAGGVLFPCDSRSKNFIKSLTRATFSVVFDVDKKLRRPTRSQLQNAYYWAVVIQYIVRGIDESYDKDEVHEMLKFDIFGSKTVISPSGYAFEKPRRSTTELKTDEMEKYLTKCRFWAQENLRLFIPKPNECGMEY